MIELFSEPSISGIVSIVYSTFLAGFGLGGGTLTSLSYSRHSGGIISSGSFNGLDKMGLYLEKGAAGISGDLPN